VEAYIPLQTGSPHRFRRDHEKRAPHQTQCRPAQRLVAMLSRHPFAILGHGFLTPLYHSIYTLHAVGVEHPSYLYIFSWRFPCPPFMSMKHLVAIMYPLLGVLVEGRSVAVERDFYNLEGLGSGFLLGDHNNIPSRRMWGGHPTAHVGRGFRRPCRGGHTGATEGIPMDEPAYLFWGKTPGSSACIVSLNGPEIP
jgi:hypothetical protein